MPTVWRQAIRHGDGIELVVAQRESQRKCMRPRQAEPRASSCLNGACAEVEEDNDYVPSNRAAKIRHQGHVRRN